MIRTLFTVAAVAGMGVAAASAAELSSPVAVQAGDKPLEVSVGHAAPFVYDFDRDGVRDLLVGQMGKGQLRIYKNTGTNQAPVFGDFVVFQAGGADGTVPSG